MSAHPPTVAADKLPRAARTRTRRGAQELRPYRNHSRHRSGGPAWRAPRDHRTQRRRQVDAVQSDQRPLQRYPGTIRLDGHDITNRKPYEINRRGLARSFQITNIFHRLSVFENLRCAVLWSLGHRYAFWKNLNKLTDAEGRAEELLRRVGLKRRRDTPAGLLTYAEQRALEIGITIAGGAQVILLDEPTAGMSRAESRRAVELIREVTQGRTLVMVEHDMSVVFGLADRISVDVYGQVIATGAPTEIRANVAVKEAYLGQQTEAA
jgi:branched-chain amino acid transport system ATP-binding protein